MPSGYRVIFVPFVNGRQNGLPEEILTGFLDAGGHARGRPVGVGVDRTGALLVADDVGNTIWRVTRARSISSVLDADCFFTLCRFRIMHHRRLATVIGR